MYPAVVSLRQSSLFHYCTDRGIDDLFRKCFAFFKKNQVEFQSQRIDIFFAAEDAMKQKWTQKVSEKATGYFYLLKS